TVSAINQWRVGSRRAAILRSQPRTVEAGIPISAAIGRCPRPEAFAANAAQIVEVQYARRENIVAGNNTCVARHDRRRPRRRRPGAATPTRRRRRAHPQAARTPPHGHIISPAARRDSTTDSTGLTVTIDAFRRQARHPAWSDQDFSEGAVHPTIPGHTDDAD